MPIAGWGQGGLAGIGSSIAQSGEAAVGEAAQLEVVRNMENQRIEQSNKSSNQKIGSAVGAVGGSFFGPMGTMAGATVGGMIGGTF